MNSKVLLLSVAVIAIGLFAMPSTLSLFAGQHTFVNGSSVSCTKCHADIYSEFSSGVSTAHDSLSGCQGCHKTGNITNIPTNGTTNTSTFWVNTSVTSNPNAHASVTMECINCHTGVDEELNGSSAAHTAFYTGALTANSTSIVKLKGGNTACVGCHTHTMINITWNRAVGYDLVSNSTGGGWDLTFSMNTTDNQTTYSSGKANATY